MVTVKVTKHKGSNIGQPKRRVVYDIVVRKPSGGILEDEMAFNKKAAMRIARTLRKQYKKK